jgi:hypothetical protein
VILIPIGIVSRDERIMCTRKCRFYRMFIPQYTSPDLIGIGTRFDAGNADYGSGIAEGGIADVS